MRHRKLGNTGLIVSELALGTMQFGGKMNMGNLGQEGTTQMVKVETELSPVPRVASGNASSNR